MDTARREGVVFLSWEPLVHVIPNHNAGLTLKWNPALLVRTQIDKDAVAHDMEAASQGKGAGKGAQLQASLAGIPWVS